MQNDMKKKIILSCVSMFIFACALINKYDDDDDKKAKNQETIIKLVHIWMSTECLK